MLNEKQAYFTKLDHPRIRLLAPAGSGKTLALLHRCLELNQKDQNSEFLLFSFTRAAVTELRYRISTDTAFASIRDVTNVCTINAWGQNYIVERAIIRNPKLLDVKSKQIQAVLNSLQSIWGQQQYKRFCDLLDGKRKERNAKIVFDLIEQTKNLGVCTDEFVKKDENYLPVWKQYLAWFAIIGLNDFVERGSFAEDINTLELNKRRQSTEQEAFAENFLPFFVDASEHLKSMGLYTFNDQKYLPFLDLREKNNRRENSSQRRKLHIFVDEFQDSSPLDSRLFQELVKYECADLVIVGDDDQAIYQFRGATPAFILKPETFFESTFETVIFETNYRSPKNIIEHSQRLIKHNTQREDKQITGSNPSEVRLEFLNASQKNNKTIFEIVTDKVSFCLAGKKNVVLVGRRRGDLLPYEIIFGRQRQQFYVDTDLNVFDSDAYRKLVKLLEIKCKPNLTPYDYTTVLNTVFRYPLSMAHRNTLIQKFAGAQDKMAIMGILYTAMASYVKKDTASATIQWFDEQNVADTLKIMADYFVGFQQDFYRSEKDVFYTEPPFSHLIDFAKEYGTDFDRFHGDLTIAATYGKRYEDGDIDETININVMTAFRTKGREFDHVFILDCDSETWPNKQAKSPEEKETERRLFYVAVTRARQEIVFAGAGVNPTPYLSEMGLDSQLREL